MKDYLTDIFNALIKKGVKGITPTIRYAIKKNIITDLLIANSDTFNTVVLDDNNSLSYNPVDANSIVVYKESTSTFYQRYTDWTCDVQAGTIKFLSTGSIVAGTNIVVDYKYYSAQSALTASQILTLIKTVDGTGSGLDSDLLDGQQGSYYSGKKILSQIILVKKGDLILDTDISPMPFYVYSPCTIKEVYIAVRTAPTGDTMIIDVNKNGTTIFTTQASRPEIAIGEYVATSEAPDVTALTKNDKLTIDCDQIGSTIAGADLIVFIRVEQVIS